MVGTTLEQLPATVASAGPSAARWRWRWPLVVAGLTAASRLPSFGRPLGADEAGFLTLAHQWRPGTSLYGDYWVDRPPLLLDLFALGDRLGGAVGLRLVGVVAAVACVLLAAQLVAVLAPASPRARIAGAVLAASLCATPLFGAGEVDGELLGLPFDLLGLLAVVCALRRPLPGPALRWWFLAGTTGAAAVLVKQNLADVIVLGAVVLIGQARTDRARARRSGAAFAAGLLSSVAVVVGAAAARGTSPTGLWSAVVAFRLQAITAISASDPASPPRAAHLAVAFLLSLAWGVLVLAVPSWRRGVRDPLHLRLGLATLLAWEAFSIGFGGSYWPHYLLDAVPALLVAAAQVLRVCPRTTRRLLLAVTACAVSATAAWAWTVGHGSGTSPQRTVEEYLLAHEQPGDTGLVAFGEPDILRAAHLASPYPYLWSLPVKVRDPRTVVLASVLAGPARPDWVVETGASLASWGVDSGAAQAQLDRHYVRVAQSPDYVVLHVRVPARRAVAG